MGDNMGDNINILQSEVLACIAGSDHISTTVMLHLWDRLSSYSPSTQAERSLHMALRAQLMELLVRKGGMLIAVPAVTMRDFCAELSSRSTEVSSSMREN